VIEIDGLIEMQERTYATAGEALRRSWPPELAMDSATLRDFLEQHMFCVFAAADARGRPQARPVAFTVLRSSFWFATVAGARLRNVQRTPWVSVVIAEGDGDHRAVIVDGPSRSRRSHPRTCSLPGALGMAMPPSGRLPGSSSSRPG
jgi:hypothetical protein